MPNILVVDDEPALLRAVERYLTRLGYDVSAAANGKEALAAMDDWSPDLLITDINMPEMDGIEVLNTLRARGSAIPVIAISGGGQFDRRLLLGSAKVLGAVLTLEKPFELEELREMVEEVLKG